MDLRGTIFLGSFAVATATALGAAPVMAQDTAACEREYTIGFSHPVGEAAFVAALRKKVREYAERDGCVTVLIDNTQANNLETQRSALESWITSNVDAIVVLPVDAAALFRLQESAQAAGIKWLTYAAPTEGSDGSVGFDNVASGRLVAEDALAWVAQTHPDGNITAAVTTLTPLPAFSGRWEVPLELFKEAGLPVVSTQDCADQECGLQIAEDTLRQHPDLRVFIGLNDDAAAGALRAFTNARINLDEVYVAGQDGSPVGLDAVQRGGAYRASAAIDLEKLAELIVQNSIAAASGAPGSDTQVSIVLVTSNDPEVLQSLIDQYK